MTDKPLNFDPDSLGAFDTAPDPADALGAFDAAAGVTHVPAGNYVCQIVAGELVTSKTGKPCYRIRLVVDEPGEYAGHTLMRYFALTPAAVNYSKAQLAPLGLRTGADLRKPFPEPGRVLVVRAVVGIQQRPDGSTGNDVVRFAVERDETKPVAANPFAVPEAGQEGDDKP